MNAFMLFKVNRNCEILSRDETEVLELLVTCVGVFPRKCAEGKRRSFSVSGKEVSEV